MSFAVRDKQMTKAMTEFAIPNLIALVNAAANILDVPTPFDFEQAVHTTLGTGACTTSLWIWPIRPWKTVVVRCGLKCVGNSLQGVSSGARFGILMVVAASVVEFSSSGRTVVGRVVPKTTPCSGMKEPLGYSY